MAKGACSGSAHTKSDFSAGSDGDLTGMTVCDPLSHANATSRATTRSPRSSIDLPDGGCRAIGLGTSVEDSFPSRAGSTGLSLSPSALESLKEVGPRPSKGGGGGGGGGSPGP